MDFLKQIQRITYVNNISNEQAACYLSNYEDGYICHKHNSGCKNIDICRKISESERKTKIMPDEVLVSMEDQIIERFMDRLKGLLFSDPRIHKTDAFYAVDNVNKAAKSYNRLYEKEKKVVTVEQKIDYMVQSLELAKEEIVYAKEYFGKRDKDDNFYQYGHMGYDSRNPNGTLIRESLKQVGRMAHIVANDVTLSPYCNQLFREK